VGIGTGASAGVSAASAAQSRRGGRAGVRAVRVVVVRVPRRSVILRAGRAAAAVFAAASAAFGSEGVFTAAEAPLAAAFGASVAAAFFAVLVVFPKNRTIGSRSRGEL
jgi:hypothetical protein